MTGEGQMCAVMAAAASDFNDELTIILTSASKAIGALPSNHAARPLVIEMQRAAQRCARKSSGLLAFSVRKGARPQAAPMEKLIDG